MQAPRIYIDAEFITANDTCTNVLQTTSKDYGKNLIRLFVILVGASNSTITAIIEVDTYLSEPLLSHLKESSYELTADRGLTCVNKSFIHSILKTVVQK